MATAEPGAVPVVIYGPAGGYAALRDGLTERGWRVLGAEDVGFEWPERCGLVGISDGAGPALRRARHEPERVETLVLIAATAVRPAGGDVNGESAALEGQLHDVQCPTLVVFGRDDTSVAPEATSIYRERIPNCSIAFVYDAGHDVVTERPGALVNLVADYLERRETFIVQNRSNVVNP